MTYRLVFEEGLYFIADDSGTHRALVLHTSSRPDRLDGEELVSDLNERDYLTQQVEELNSELCVQEELREEIASKDSEINNLERKVSKLEDELEPIQTELDRLQDAYNELMDQSSALSDRECALDDREEKLALRVALFQESIQPVSPRRPGLVLG